ncbi:response regulator [Chroococcidiopsis sp. FACHB-1243]|uniref:response regulator transcription factor n=1 Tax=Chroococcidiopsis sp. [FACHB-1243] TaxID=2692781 RepID=UPI001785C874|nr:response regulator [Chroococcidiopsis sp. [FACHB-1243]]MBD2307916.1 response regulator [Chroococcidiopsis sp. [FACHB-1243]]
MTKVLAIEDDALLRDSIVNVLTLRGLTAIAAENGYVGLKLAQENLPNLVLCDVRMPGLSGYEVLKSLREDPNTAAIPFIFLTAENTPEVMAMGANLGANGYLCKPFSTAELMTAIAPFISDQ